MHYCTKTLGGRVIFQMDETVFKGNVFLDMTTNTVKIQIYYVIIANTLKIERRIYEILQIFSISLLDKSPVIEVFTGENDCKDVKELKNKQLKSNGF